MHFHRLVHLMVSKRFCTIAKILKDGPSNSPIKISGWILHRREHKQCTFLAVTDGLSPDTVQVVFDKGGIDEKLRIGSAVTMTGSLIPSRGRGQKYDFVPDSIDFVGENDTQHYPLGGKEKREDGYLRQYLHLRPKLASFSTFLRLRSAAKHWLLNYFKERGFLYIDTPIFTLNDCEGAGEAFHVEPADKVKFGDATVTEIGPDGVERQSKRYFFSRPVYTTVSAQLHLEAAACSLGKVYAFNPAFRAESCLSRHHLSEFYMLEAEIAFIDDLESLLQIVEDVFKKCSVDLINNLATDYVHCAKFHNASHMKIVENTLKSNKQFPRLSFEEAVGILEKGASKNLFPPVRKDGLTKVHEQYLVQHCGNMPVFITEFKADAKPFYMARSRINPDNADCFDFLTPLTGEIVGGGLREGDYNALENRLIQIGHREKLEWYLDLRRFGYPRTGGFGFGFERYLQWLLGINNIKDALPYPRWYNHCYL